ncbi:MAG TPA: cytochrome c-type biogenesis protein [Thermoanaerobaculia bacterium]|nr:cytochrome c-type biogenesis protein [Thermoanaerobaculia bacterium]
MILALILLLLDAPRATPLQGPALEQRTQEIASGLRCPVCQGLSIADSPSEMAVNMKAEVRSMLAKGYTREQIETYFVRSYGEFVLLEPKFQGVNALVWILPIAALILGAFAVRRVLRKLTAAPPSQPRVSADDPDLARVRELVKGATP